MPIPVAERSKTWFCGRSPTGIAGSNTAWGVDVCFSVVSIVCVVRSLRRADHSSRGVLPTVVRHCVWSCNLRNEEAQTREGCKYWIDEKE
jgi:hypothetical protein